MLTIEERFSAALHKTARAWRQALDRRLKDLGVGQAGWMAIATIAKSERSPSQTELAHQLGVEDPTMVSMIDRLVKAGFVLRQPSETDRRVKLVVLTAAGQDINAKVKAAADAFRLELLRDVDAERLRLATELLESLLLDTERAL
ncbi:MAG TPA: hypothetical protein DCW29_07590 [Janthinobacterium sp.]|nr:hypothetical protein [Janthinobacterium sp.]